MSALRAENETLRTRVAELEAKAGGGAATAKEKGAEGSQPRTPTGAGSRGVSPTDDLTNDKSSSNTNSGGGDGGSGGSVCRSSLGKAGMTAAEIARYSRHLLVPAVGVEGQR